MGFVLCQWLISKHSPVSWCDGWGWKLENTYDSQLCGATKRVGHMHFELYIRCWELCYGKMIAVFVGGYARNSHLAQQYFSRGKAVGVNRETRL